MSAIGLTTIYQALRSPTHQAANDCRQSLRAADLSEIDHLFRRIASASKKQNARWSIKRLLRCADYILIHCHPTKQILGLRSLRLCTKLATGQLSARLNVSTPDDDNDDLERTVLAAAKFVSSLLKCSTQMYNANDEADSIHNLLLREQCMVSLLHWSVFARNLHVRLYALNAMSINVKYFTSDLVQHDAFWILSSIVSENSTALDDATTTTTTHTFEITVNAARLLSQLLKNAKPLSDPTQRIKAVAYADSVNFVAFLQSFSTVCRNYVQSSQISHLQKLVYPLTDVISQCASISSDARQRVQQHAPIPLRHGVLIHEMRGFLSTIHQEQISSGGYASNILRLLQILLSCDLNKSSQHRTEILQQILQDVTNMLFAVSCMATQYDYGKHIGFSGLVPLELSTAVDYTPEIETKRAEILLKYESMFDVLLEVLGRLARLANHSAVSNVSAHVASILSTYITTLSNNSSLELTMLRRRLQRLVIYFLQYEPAVDVFSKTDSSMDTFLWEPILSQAEDGLTELVNGHIDNISGDDDRVLRQTRYAFVALITVSRHKRATERLMAMDIMRLVDVDLIADVHILERSTACLQLYALLMHFLASMADMALMRTRLREHGDTGPLTMKLLWLAIIRKEQLSKADPQDERSPRIIAAWDLVLQECLELVNAFEYDTVSMKKWLAWPVDGMQGVWIKSMDIGECTISILPAIFMILLPFGQETKNVTDDMLQQSIWALNPSVLSAAIAAFEHLSVVPECGCQMATDPSRFRVLCQLLLLLCAEAQDTKARDTKRRRRTSDPFDLEPLDMQSACKEEPRVWEEPATCVLDVGGTGQLYRGLVRAITTKECTQALIISDSFTTLFEPLLQSDDEIKRMTREKLCADLQQRRMDDHVRFFTFTADDDGAEKLHELAAVAVCYCCAERDDSISIVLGSKEESSVLYSTSMLGTLCRMLLHETFVKHDEPLSFSRRHAAAQAIEILAQRGKRLWRLGFLCDGRTEPRRTPSPSIEPSLDATVAFLTQPDKRMLYAKRSDVVRDSPYFSALLSGQYEESISGEPIVLQDVAYEDLKLYLENSIRPKLPEDAKWNELIGILLLADRFGNRATSAMCENWIVHKFSNDELSTEDINGAVTLFRRCRHPDMPAGGLFLDTWPFQKMLQYSLQIIVGRLSLASETAEFRKMIADNDERELDMFCEGIAAILKGLKA